MVADMPRFTTTVKPVRAAARSSGVLCIERAPIIRASTCGSSWTTCSTSSGSAITGNPVARRASSSSARPSAPMPWKASGAVRGL